MNLRKNFKKVSQSAVRPHNVFLIWLVMTKGVFVFVLSYVVSLLKTYEKTLFNKFSLSSTQVMYREWYGKYAC